MGFSFIIDTDKYAGNFEREICAFVTGRIGEDGVGEEEGTQYIKDGYDPLEFVENRFDEDDLEDDTYRPVNVYPTPGWFNHGLGKEFKDGEEEKALKILKQDAADNCKKQNDKIKNYKHWPLESREQSIKQNTETMLAVVQRETIIKYPAYLSVAIFCSRQPTTDEMFFMQERARLYVKDRNINISGFRLLVDSKPELINEKDM
jgi:hypothetical protein